MTAILIMLNESRFADIFDEMYLIIYDMNDRIEEEKLILNRNIWVVLSRVPTEKITIKIKMTIKKQYYKYSRW